MVGALQEAVGPAGEPIPNVHRQQALPGHHTICSTYVLLTLRSLLLSHALTRIPHSDGIGLYS